jgi:hypothetical protein
MQANISDSSDNLQAHPDTAVKESRVRLGISNLPPAPTPRPFLSLRRLYRNSSFRVLCDEIGALGHRIRWVLQIREAESLGHPAEILAWMDGCAVHGPKTRDYILYMQQVRDKCPFLSIFDTLLLTEAWKAGWESSALEGTSHDRIDGLRS